MAVISRGLARPVGACVSISWEPSAYVTVTTGYFTPGGLSASRARIQTLSIALWPLSGLGRIGNHS
jgi:hypothetical protein